MGTKVVMFISVTLSISIIQKICFAGDTINSTHSLKDGDETIVSSGGIFELGFFSPNNSSNRYVGIWYKQIRIRTVVWVANRDTPITNTRKGFLKFINPGCRLALVDGNNSIFWHTNNTSKLVQNPVAKLLDSGNLVIINGANEGNILWQSFDYPTDTLLAGMILGKNFLTGVEISLSSWKTENNPASGEYKLFVESTGYPQLILRNGGDEVYRSGPWNGLRWSGSPGQEKKDTISETYVIVNTTGIFSSYKVFDTSTLLRIVVASSGNLQIYLWVDETEEWNNVRVAPSDVCDRYGYCGGYGSCDYNNYPNCGCLDKFLPKNPVEWGRSKFSGGCVRKTRLSSSCQNGSSSDGFLKYSGIKLPDTKFSQFNTTMNLKECEQVCLRNCSCTAYSSLDISNGENGCLLWFGNLIDIKVLPERGQDIFIRMAASDLDYSSSSKGKKLKLIALSSSLLIGLLVLSLAVILMCYKQKREWKHKELKLKFDEDHTLFEASTIIRATHNFSLGNKIGEGGYGPVFKGVLEDGREIAVKRLSKTSTQGVEEFKNEVNFIAKLQHRNLVKLLGWCIQGEEKMLIYEYMPNKSLDTFIFDHTRRTLLDWPKRFNIVNGIARGLLYLHQDSRLRIIHRDLKASNILLDIDMYPKISDFGLARCIGGNDSGANTRRLVGTHGYMSPEYAGHGIFSTKSDVYSFGVSVLEIVSGKKSAGFSHQDRFENLLSYAWKLNKDGRSIELVDESLTDSCNLTQVLRSIHVGLLCVQQYPDDRPSMSCVVQMLTNNAELPIAKEPGFFIGRKVIEAKPSSGSEISTSINEITISMLSPR